MAHINIIMKYRLTKKRGGLKKGQFISRQSHESRDLESISSRTLGNELNHPVLLYDKAKSSVLAHILFTTFLYSVKN